MKAEMRTDTPQRSVRISDAEWNAAMARAEAEHEKLASVIRRLLREYVAEGIKK